MAGWGPSSSGAQGGHGYGSHFTGENARLRARRTHRIHPSAILKGGKASSVPLEGWGLCKGGRAQMRVLPHPCGSVVRPGNRPRMTPQLLLVATRGPRGIRREMSVPRDTRFSRGWGRAQCFQPRKPRQGRSRWPPTRGRSGVKLVAQEAQRPGQSPPFGVDGGTAPGSRTPSQTPACPSLAWTDRDQGGAGVRRLYWSGCGGWQGRGLWGHTVPSRPPSHVSKALDGPGQAPLSPSPRGACARGKPEVGTPTEWPRSVSSSCGPGRLSAGRSQR